MVKDREALTKGASEHIAFLTNISKHFPTNRRPAVYRLNTDEMFK